MTSPLQSIADWARRWAANTLAELRAVRCYPPGVRFRIFAPSDEAACLELYRSLESGFPEAGTDNFLASIRNPDNAYVVAERDGIVIGMGGISLSGECTATLYYGLVAPAHQGTGIGTALALLRLCSLPSDDFGVIIYTLRKPQSFYRKLGFQAWLEWEDRHGEKHPMAVLDLAGFRADRVLEILESRGVTLEGTLVPRLQARFLIDRSRQADGNYLFKPRPESLPEEAS